MKAAVAVAVLFALVTIPCVAQEQPPAAQPPAAAQAPAQEIAPPLPDAAPAQAAAPAVSGDKTPMAKIWDGTKELGSKTGTFFGDTGKKTGSFFGNAGQKTGSFFKGLFVKD